MRICPNLLLISAIKREVLKVLGEWIHAEVISFIALKARAYILNFEFWNTFKL